jgi:CubicO group peptidase (beta-lactamase class C family)
MDSPLASIQGHCDPRFQSVRDEFERNFREREEVGASVCLSIGGETVVDLWGGKVRPDSPEPWDRDTISVVWSCTKGAAALCAHILASRGQLDLDAPVAQYWPEMGQAGKGAIPVRMLLDHQAGLAVLQAPVPEDGFTDPELMARMLAEQAPLWPPGTRHGYHALMFGWLVGEVVRRVSGRSIGRFFREEVAGPLGLDFWIGLPEEHEARVAPMILPSPDVQSPFFQAMISNPASLQALVYNVGGLMQKCNDRAAHAAEVAGAMGITNARGLAGMYAPLACGGSLRGVSLVDSKAIARMIATASATGVDAVLLLATRFSLGFMKGIDNRRGAPGAQESAILGEQAFGHAGFGGSIGFADPVEKLAFGYTMNRMGSGVLLNPRGQSLIDAVYRSLGYTSDAPGVWIR